MKANSKVLIIGGAGFIGINTCQRFIDSGWDVTILDNLSRKGTDLNISWLGSVARGKFKFVKADILLDETRLSREVARHDAVLHLAAQVAVTTSVKDPRHDFNLNALGTLNILEAIRNSKGKKPILIYASTNKVYGDLVDLEVVERPKRYELRKFPKGVDETRQLDFHSPYGCSKGAADQYVRDYARIYGLQTVVFRQSCIYGRHQFGIEDQGWIAWFVIAALTRKPIKLYGNGKQVRDVLFADDLCQLYLTAIEKIQATSGEIFNAGGGPANSISLLELFDKLNKDHKITVSYKYSPVRPGDQKVFVSDNSKIARLMGWKPTTSIDKGVSELIAWTKDNLALIKSLY